MPGCIIILPMYNNYYTCTHEHVRQVGRCALILQLLSLSGTGFSDITSESGGNSDTPVPCFAKRKSQIKINFILCINVIVLILCTHVQRKVSTELGFEIKQTWVKSSNFVLFIKQLHHEGWVGMKAVTAGHSVFNRRARRSCAHAQKWASNQGWATISRSSHVSRATA